MLDPQSGVAADPRARPFLGGSGGPRHSLARQPCRLSVADAANDDGRRHRSGMDEQRLFAWLAVQTGWFTQRHRIASDPQRARGE